MQQLEDRQLHQVRILSIEFSLQLFNRFASPNCGRDLGRQRRWNVAGKGGKVTDDPPPIGQRNLVKNQFIGVDITNREAVDFSQVDLFVIRVAPHHQELFALGIANPKVHRALGFGKWHLHRAFTVRGDRSTGFQRCPEIQCSSANQGDAAGKVRGEGIVPAASKRASAGCWP